MDLKTKKEQGVRFLKSLSYFYWTPLLMIQYAEKNNETCKNKQCQSNKKKLYILKSTAMKTQNYKIDSKCAIQEKM